MILNNAMRKRYFTFLFLGILAGAGWYAWIAQRTEQAASLARSEKSKPLMTNSHGTISPVLPPPMETSTLAIDAIRITDEDRSSPAKPPSIEEQVQALEARVNQAVAKISPLPSEQIQNALLEAFNSLDSINFNIAKNELIARARRGDKTALAAIQSALNDTPPKLQAYLASMLGEIATDSALQILLEVLDTSLGQNREMRYAALEAISNIGKHRGQNAPTEALSSLLENYFQTITVSDQSLLSAVVMGLSTIGTAQGVERVLRFVDLQESAKTVPPELFQRMAESLRQVRNPAAMVPLQARLQQDPELNRQSTHMAGDALAAMGDVQATEVLLRWAADMTGKAQTKQALAWFSQVRDEQSLQQLLHAEEHRQFRDPQMLERISTLAKQIDQQSTPELAK